MMVAHTYVSTHPSSYPTFQSVVEVVMCVRSLS